MFPLRSWAAFISIIQMAVPNAPQALPLRPMPPARPAAITMCWPAKPIFSANMAAQLTGAGRAAGGAVEKVALISPRAAWAHLAAMPKHEPVTLLFRRKRKTICIFGDDRLISVISAQLMWRF